MTDPIIIDKLDTIMREVSDLPIKMMSHTIIVIGVVIILWALEPSGDKK